MGLENITEDLTELDLLAVTLFKELQSGQKNSYFEKMNLYELPFEWDIDEINCLPVQCRRQGYFLWAVFGHNHCEVENIPERKVMHTKKIISHLEWKMNEAASANKTDLVSREDLGNHTYVMTHEYST